MKRFFFTFLSSVIMLSLWSQNPSWKVDKLWATYNETVNGEKGMRVHAEFSIKNVKDKSIAAYILFFGDDKKNMRNPNAASEYKFSSNAIYSRGQTVTSSEPNVSWRKYSVFIPYNQFPEGKTQETCYYQMYLCDMGTGKYLPGSSELIPFVLTRPFKRSVVRTWKEVYSTLTYRYTLYNDEWTECQIFGTCPTICMNCSGTGKIRQELIFPNFHYVSCPYCNATGKCSTCKGTGQKLIGTNSYLEGEFYFSNGKTAFHLSSFRATGSSIFQIPNQLTICSMEPMTDAGSTWQCGPVEFARDYSSMTYLGVTYNRCTPQEYQRLGGSITPTTTTPPNNVYVPYTSPTVPPTIGGGTSGGATKKECKRCLGTGMVPVANNYPYYTVNATWCDGKYPTTHTCNVYPCNECKKNHCTRLRHVHCDSCIGGYK